MTIRTPNSLAARSLLAIADAGEMTPKEFTRRVKAACKNESEMSRAASELYAQGFIARRVMLTAKAQKAIEDLKGRE
jgi:hypothetical protein